MKLQLFLLVILLSGTQTLDLSIGRTLETLLSTPAFTNVVAKLIALGTRITDGFRITPESNKCIVNNFVSEAAKHGIKLQGILDCLPMSRLSIFLSTLSAENFPVKSVQDTLCLVQQNVPTELMKLNDGVLMDIYKSVEETCNL